MSPDANETDAIATLAHDVNRSLMEAANGDPLCSTSLGCFNSAARYPDLLQRRPCSRCFL